MWLYFNKQGQLITSLEHGEPARAGTTAFSIYAVFEDVDSSVFDGYATIKLFKPDLHGSSYPILLMKPEVKDFVLQEGEKNDNVLPFKQTDSPYRGFCFDFADFNSTQDTEVLLDTSGLWKAVIVLIGNNLNVQGVATFNVQDGVVSQDGANVNIDLILFEVLSEIHNKLNINKGVYVIDEDIEDIPEDTLAGFEDGQLFFNKYDLKMYELEIVEGDPTTYTLNEMNLGYSIEDGTGDNAVQQKRDTETVNFTGRNPNAEALDSSLSDTFETGASGVESVALNGNTMAMAKRSMSNGNKTIAKGEESHAEGYQSVTLGDGSHAEGNETVAYGNASHSEGILTQAIGNESHTEGNQTTTYAQWGHAEGVKTIVKDNYLVVDSGDTPSPIPTPTPEPATPEEKDALNGVGAHTEGHSNFALGLGAHAEGVNNKAYGRFSHVEGGENQSGEIIIRKTEDGKDYYTPNQDKQYQHAEGYQTIAKGTASHAEGLGTIANQDFQHVSGKYNANNSDAIVIVGKGTDDTHRSNALEVLTDGRVAVGADGIQNADLPRMSQVRLWKHTIYLTQPGNFRLVVIDKSEESISGNLLIQGRTLNAISHKLIFSQDNTIMQLIGFPVVNMSVNIRYIDGTGAVVTSPLTINYDLVTNY